MCLHTTEIGAVPEETARVAKAVFRRGHPYLRLRDTLGTFYTDAAFAALYPQRGQPALPPWRIRILPRGRSRSS